MRPHRAFALAELVTVVVIIVVALAIAFVLLPLGGSHHRRPAHQMQNSTQIRGIHQGLVMYAQGNKGYFPGINPDGSDGDLSVEARLHLLLKNNYFTGEYAIAPVETKTAWTTGPVTPNHHSYALLQVPAAGGRRVEWSETLNTEAIALSDRNTRTAAAPLSVWAGYRSSPSTGWRGSVAWNDNHVSFESTHVLTTAYAMWRPTAASPASTPSTTKIEHFPADDLFTPAGDHDALLIHSGIAAP